MNKKYFLAAVSNFKKAISENPEDEKAYISLANLYIIHKMYSHAKKYLHSVLKINPENEMAHNKLGIIAEIEDDYDNAFYHYNKAVQINPSFEMAYHNLRRLGFAPKKTIIKEKKDEIILSCPYCGSFFYRENIFLWLREHKNCPECRAILRERDLIPKKWEKYKHEKCSIDMLSFER